MVYVRSLDMISYRKMSLFEPNRGGGGGGGGGGGRGQGAAPLGPREQAGQGVYTQRCSTCHGAGQMPMRSITVLGSEGFRAVVRRGVNSMPGFPESVISNDALEGLESYLMSLPTSEEQAGNPSEIRLPQNPNRYQGPPTRYGGSFSAGWYTSNGYPVTGPPWSQLVAYDLNDGTIKWRVADGVAPGVVGVDHKTPAPSGRRTVRSYSRGGLPRQFAGLFFSARRQGNRRTCVGHEWSYPEDGSRLSVGDGSNRVPRLARLGTGPGASGVEESVIAKKIEAPGYHL